MIFTLVKQFGQDPFLVLMACLLSLRTKDTTTLPASIRLFNKARTPSQMLTVPQDELEKLIYPVGFYRRKAAQLHTVSRILLNNFDGKVPNTEAELLSIPGIGRKTANLVLGEAFNIPSMCVDTHVHRISNRLGLISTSTPEETEIELKAIVPQEYWIEYNRLLVIWGQNVCVPISPFCSQCPVYDECQRVDIITHR